MVLMLGLVITGCDGDITDVELIESFADASAVIEVGYEDIEDMEVYDGEITLYMNALSFPQKGRFEEYRVSLGDSVKAGDVIATTIDEYEDSIRDLRKDIVLAETEYNNAVTNYDLQLATNSWRVGEYRSAIEFMEPTMPGFDAVCIRFEMMMAQGRRIDLEKQQYIARQTANIEYMKSKLNRMINKSKSNAIYAPCDGKITYLAALKMGDNISAADSPVMMTQNDIPIIKTSYQNKANLENKLRIYAYKDGKEYNLSIFDYPEGDYEYRSSHGEKVNSLFTVDVPDEGIRIGDSLKVIMDIDKRNNVLAVPVNCLVYNGSEIYVYKLENNERKLTPVRIGLKDKTYAEILEGLQAGDYVYADN